MKTHPLLIIMMLDVLASASSPAQPAPARMPHRIRVFNSNSWKIEHKLSNKWTGK
jgi:hypothetical protein